MVAVLSFAAANALTEDAQSKANIKQTPHASDKKATPCAPIHRYPAQKASVDWYLMAIPPVLLWPWV
jgi:hypothetical protein